MFKGARESFRFIKFYDLYHGDLLKLYDISCRFFANCWDSIGLFETVFRYRIVKILRRLIQTWVETVAFNWNSIKTHSGSDKNLSDSLKTDLDRLLIRSCNQNLRVGGLSVSPSRVSHNILLVFAKRYRLPILPMQLQMISFDLGWIKTIDQFLSKLLAT